MIERGHPLSADSSRASSEIAKWLQNSRSFWWMMKFLNAETHTSSSHEVSLELTSKRREDLGKHNVSIHFLKDRNCEICLRTNVTKASCRTRTGGAVPRAENFGDLITADHKILNEEGDSRDSHCYTVVVQDLATQWIQSSVKS